MIKTSRLHIRKLGYRDCDDYYEIFGNPDIAKYDDFEPIEPGETRSNIERIIRSYEQQGNDQEFAVEHRGERKVIGVLAILIEDETLFLGFHFNGRYHGQGLATEAVAAFIPWLAKNWDLPIKAVTDPANRPSIKLLGKLGFQLEKKIVRRDKSRVVRELQYELPKALAVATPVPRPPRFRRGKI